MKFIELMFYTFVILFFGLISCSNDDPDPETPYAAPDSVVFNEIHSTGNPDWIELYNYGNADVDLAGWIVFDKEENKYSLPSGNILKPGDFIILNCDDQGTGLNMPFKLTSEGESITLQRPDGKMVSRQRPQPCPDGKSFRTLRAFHRYSHGCCPGCRGHPLFFPVRQVCSAEKTGNRAQPRDHARTPTSDIVAARSQERNRRNAVH